MTTDTYQLLQMQYRADPETGEQVEWGQAVQRLSDMACIPPDENNRDYAQFLVERDEGAEVRPYIEPPAPVPAEISDRQFFQQLAMQDIISQADALAAVKTGAVPAPLQAIVDAMPADQQFGAEMIISGAATFQRQHPMTIIIGTAYGWTSEQMDAFFVAAAAL